MGTAVAQWLRCCVTNRKVAGSIPAGVGGFFIDIKSFRSYYDPGVDSASNRNEYRGYFLGVKSGRCVRLTTLPPSCAVVTKSGSINFLEPSGPVQAFNRTALLYMYYCGGLFSDSVRRVIREGRILNASGSKESWPNLRQGAVRI